MLSNSFLYRTPLYTVGEIVVAARSLMGKIDGTGTKSAAGS